MKYVALFDDFDSIDESYSFESDSLLEAKLNQMTMLREGCLAAWTRSEFSEFFSPMLNENNNDEERGFLLEKAYHTYELGVMYENNQDWFDGGDDIYYMKDPESDSAILFKNGRLHMIENESLEAAKRGELITEGFWSSVGGFFSNVYAGAKNLAKKAVNAVNTYVVQPVKKAASWVADKVKKAWDWLSAGAIKIWNFCKKIYAAVKAFATENPLTAIGIALQILATVVSFIPGVGTAISGVLLMIAGGITAYEGGLNIYKASKEIGKADKVATIVKGGAKIVLGSVSAILGIRDIIAAGAEALPGMGGFGMAIKTSVVTWSTKFTKTAFGGFASAGAGKALGCSEWLGEFFQTLCKKAPFMKNLADKPGLVGKITKVGSMGADAGKGSGQDAILANSGENDLYVWDQTINEDDSGSWGFGDLIVNFLAYVGNACFSWIYNGVVSAISTVGSAIKSLMNLPGRISKSIENGRKNATSWIGGKIFGALSYVVKPITNCAQRFVDNYIKPKVEPMANWMISLGKRNKSITAAIKANPKLKSPVGGVKKTGQIEIPKKNVEVKASDKKNFAKIGDKGMKTLVKAGGGSEKILQKLDKKKDDFKKKFPGVDKLKGAWTQSKSGESIFTYKSSVAGGYVSLYNNSKYLVLDGPNKKAKGDFKSSKNKKITLIEPKGGFKKKSNESRNYVNTFESFSYSF